MSSSQNSRVIDPEGISYAVTNGHKDGEPKIVEKNTPIIYDDYNSKFPQEQDVIGTITTQIGNPAPRHGFKIVEPLRIPQATKQGYIEVPPGSLFDASYPESKTRRGRVQEGGTVSPTLMASGEAPCLYEGVELSSQNEYEKKRVFGEINETNTREILRILRYEAGEETYKWAIGRLFSIFKSEVLQQGLHEEVICETRDDKSRLLSGSSLFKEDSLLNRREEQDVRNMRLSEEHRRTSQGWELSKQFQRQFDDIVSKLSLETTSIKECMSYLWEACKSAQLMQSALSSLEEAWRSHSQTLEHIQTPKYRIRKLTPRECFRLQGVSESDIDKIQKSGVSQSQQYKMAGNSIVVDVLEHIFRKLFVSTGQESQQLSLF